MKLYSWLVLLAALWGASFLFLRISSTEFGPAALVFVRTGVAAAVLLPFVFLAGKHVEILSRWRHFLFVGTLSTALPFSLFAYATMFIAAGQASILNATTPFFSAIVAFYWLNERLTMLGIAGLLLGFSGVYFLSQQNGAANDDGGYLPIVAILIATFLYALSSSFVKAKMTDLQPLVVAAGSQFYSALVLFPFAVIYSPKSMPSVKAWTGAISIAVLSTALALIIFFRLLQRYGVAKTVSVTYLIPLFGVLWGYLFLGEEITIPMALGGGLVLLGVSFTSGLYERLFTRKA